MIHIYRLEEDDRFNISIYRGEDGFEFNLTLEELETLHDEISKELKKTEEENNEMVWNPRSQRHETVKKLRYEMDRHMENTFQI